MERKGGRDIFQNLKKEIVAIEVSGGKLLNGCIVDSSDELIVLYVKNKFVYVPFEHIHSFYIDTENENNLQSPSEIPAFISKGNENLTLKNILSLATGIHAELMVAKNEPLHGVITKVLDDYIVFESPVYKSMFIAQRHLKWLIPHFHQFPYGLNEQEFLHLSSKNSTTFQNTFASQIANLANQFVILNLGKNFSHIGRIKNVNHQLITIENGKSILTYFNLSHIQILQLV
ncbi:hypothetical protein NST62_07250 [Ureibacillus sp. FSL K6-8385]|uniref:DUF2642 domain-containing protein n=1 Tax=Ureibacillus terrenus TaxID=118246 RepID=A0A540V6G0_9BACL|nr:hypothetical protein [Ureibacillus terrenus]MED3661552.1 hypothetical protein [Ureibacillus terrenus]TQE91763.1 hypothetical protein FKZ59_03315 [Ureibacillus terrenus]